MHEKKRRLINDEIIVRFVNYREALRRNHCLSGVME
jgi:hypothetical protein